MLKTVKSDCFTNYSSGYKQNLVFRCVAIANCNSVPDHDDVLKNEIRDKPILFF